MRQLLLSLGLLVPAAGLAQTPTPPTPRNTLLLRVGPAVQTNYGWPGTALFLGLSHRLSPTSLWAVEPRLGGFRADSRSLEPDKQPGEKYATGVAEVLLAWRTSRRPERLALRLEAGPALFAGREVKLFRYPGQYLNSDGTTTVVLENEYRRETIFAPGFTLGLGLDVTLPSRLYLGLGIDSRTYSYFPGDLLGANIRVGYAL